MTKFGVQLPNFSGFDPADLFEHVAGLATTAEEAGFDSVWVIYDFFQLPPLGGPYEPMLEAYTQLGARAARTGRVQLGTLVTGVTYLDSAPSSRQDRYHAGRHLAGPGHPRNRGRPGTTPSIRGSASPIRATGSASTCWRKRSR